MVPGAQKPHLLPLTTTFHTQLEFLHITSFLISNLQKIAKSDPENSFEESKRGGPFHLCATRTYELEYNGLTFR